MFKILIFFNRAPFNMTSTYKYTKAHTLRSVCKRVSLFSRLHFTCFTISSWQECNYYISIFLIKTIFIVKNLYRLCADPDIFSNGGGGRDKCRRGGLFQLFYYVNLINLKYPGGVSPTPNPTLDPRMKISTIMNVR